MKLCDTDVSNCICYFILKFGMPLPTGDNENFNFHNKNPAYWATNLSSSISFGNPYWKKIHIRFSEILGGNYTYRQIYEKYIKEISELDKLSEK